MFASSAINGVSGLIEGNWQKFGAQTLGTVFSMVYAFVVTYGILKLPSVFEPIRVPGEFEDVGIDTSLDGEIAYDLAQTERVAV